MNKQQACELLGISDRTLSRRMADGTVKFGKVGEGQFAGVNFTRSGLGLPELPQIKLPYQDPAPVRVRCEPKHFILPTPAIEKKQQEDLAFARKYLSGSATDSFGNKIDGTNDTVPTTGAATLVRPHPVDYTIPLDSQAHMSEVHRINTDVPSANDNPLNAGVDLQTLDAMRVAWSRQGGGRSQSEMEKKIRNDKTFMHLAFPRG